MRSAIDLRRCVANRVETACTRACAPVTCMEWFSWAPVGAEGLESVMYGSRRSILFGLWL